MEYCGECGLPEDEVDLMENWNGQKKCNMCLDDDINYWKSRYYDMTNTAEYYIEQLEKTNNLLDNLVKALEVYEVNFSGEYPDEYILTLEIKEKSEKVLQKNALDKLTRDSEEYGLYKFDHPSFYEEK